MKLFNRNQSQGDRENTQRNDRSQNLPSSALAKGYPAPDFVLSSSIGERILFDQNRGSPVILAFYPADRSTVSGDQLVLYNKGLPLFKGFVAELLGISFDRIWSHKAFTGPRSLIFPLLSDFEPKGSVARTYGVYNQDQGTCQRVLFVIDSQGFIQWSFISPDNIDPGADGILQALESIQ